jgi:hypothetical protein
MNNEPVAWLARNQLAKKYIPISLEEREKFLPHVLQLYDDWIPLYTHPIDAVNISEQYVDKTQNNRHKLTDEEILNTWKECGESDIAKDMQANSFLKYFAKAILRKAQEK